MSDVAVVLQARMGSTRLPGKVLRRIGRSSVLARCIRRLRAADVGPVIVATTREPADDAIAREAARMGCDVLRGETDDVLARFIAAADAAGARVIVRATADNPAVDIGTTRRVLEAMARHGAEYGMEEGLPCGAATEAIAAETLRRLAVLTAEPADREHVTLFVKRHLFAFATVMPDAPGEVRRPDLRLTVDTGDDFSFMQRVLLEADEGPAPAPLPAIIHAADRWLGRVAA